MSIQQWLLVALAVVFIGICIFAYNTWQDKQNLILEGQRLHQNEVAVYDSLNKSRDSVQTLAVSVHQLNDKVQKAQGLYTALQTKYQIAIDSLRKKGSGTVVVYGDSVGQVAFSGKQGIASYTCTTLVNVRSKWSTWSLSLDYDYIETGSTLYFDKKDNVWKIKTVSLTPTVKLRGLSVLDNDAYKELSSFFGRTQDTGHNLFGIGGIVERDRVHVGFVFKPSDWMIMLNYRVFEKDNIRPVNLYENFSIGVHYFLF